MARSRRNTSFVYGFLHSCSYGGSTKCYGRSATCPLGRCVLHHRLPRRPPPQAAGGGLSPFSTRLTVVLGDHIGDTEVHAFSHQLGVLAVEHVLEVLLTGATVQHAVIGV